MAQFFPMGGAPAPEELAAYHSQVLDLKALVVELKWQVALSRFARKYRPDQARDDHGRWVDESGAADIDGGGSESNATDLSAARRLPPIVKEFGKWSARQYVSRYCEARVNRELPGEFENLTLKEIWDLARGGDARARTCMKLLQPRFRK
jgi:hypothetical protein